MQEDIRAAIWRLAECHGDLALAVELVRVHELEGALAQNARLRTVTMWRKYYLDALAVQARESAHGETIDECHQPRAEPAKDATGH